MSTHHFSPTAKPNVIPIDGACGQLSAQELEALRLLQLREPELWARRIADSEDPLLGRAAALCRLGLAHEVAPARVKEALLRVARRVNKVALDPAQRWMAARAGRPPAEVRNIRRGQ